MKETHTHTLLLYIEYIEFFLEINLLKTASLVSHLLSHFIHFKVTGTVHSN